MSHRSWLFVRGGGSVRVVRFDEPLILLISGPGHLRERHDASHLAQLDSIQGSIEKRLRDRGWVFEGMDVERRARPDRRAIPRWTDRRLHDTISGRVYVR